MPTRDEAWKLLNEYVKSDRLLKHCLSVEAAMRAYAEKKGLGATETEKWAVTGLLHDFDYEQWPDEHPVKGSAILKEKGYPEDVIEAILGHNQERSGVERKTPIAKTLFAVDELTGMIMATAYVRPANFEGMTPKSVKKNLKKKGFAAGVDRDEIKKGMAELDVDENEHFQLVIDAMRAIKSELGF